MNELQVLNEVRMNHVELCDLINKLRKEEGNRKELRRDSLLDKIRKEIGVMKDLKLENSLQNFLESTYVNTRGKEYPSYSMNRDGILQIASSESVYVRAKIIEYINALEDKIKELEVKRTRKEELQLKLFSDDSLEVVNAHKELVQIEVQEATRPLLTKIEEDEPKVTFADRVLKSKDNILVRQVAKLASDEGFEIGERRLYNRLREWNMICKNSTEPTQLGVSKGYFVVKCGTIDTPYGIKETRTTLVTPKGQIYIVQRLLKEQNR